MKRIVIDIKTGQVKGNIDVVENDNKSDIYKIYILKNKVIYDLAGKTPRMVMIDKKQGIKQVIDLNITDAKRGEVSLQVSDVWSRRDGRYICQLAIFGLEGFLEQSTYFWVTIKNSLFNDIGGEILADPQFEMLKQELEKFQTAFAKIDEWDRYFTETSGKIEEKYTERLNEINSHLSENTTKTNLNTNKVNELENKKATKTEVEVERKRIDLLTKIENGETEGNTELLDIRIGINGEEYDTAGSAIREQIKIVNKQLESTNDFNVFSSYGVNYKNDFSFSHFFIQTDGSIVSRENSLITNEFINDIDFLVVYKDYKILVITYDLNGNFIKREPFTQEGIVPIENSSENKYKFCLMRIDEKKINIIEGKNFSCNKFLDASKSNIGKNKVELWKYGLINSQSNIIVLKNNYMYTLNFIDTNIKYIRLDKNYQVALQYFNKDGSYIKRDPFFNKYDDVDYVKLDHYSYKYRICFRNKNETPLSIKDLNGISFFETLEEADKISEFEIEKQGFKNINNLDLWENGMIATNGQLVSKAFALRTKDFLNENIMGAIITNPDYGIAVAKYDLKGNFISRTPSHDFVDRFKFEHDKFKYKISFLKIDETQIELFEIENIIFTISNLRNEDVFNRAIGISDMGRFLSGDGTQVAIDEEKGMCYVTYNCGINTYGESYDYLNMAVFPIHQPYRVEYFDVAITGETYGDLSFTSLRDNNILNFENYIRVFFYENITKTVWYRDFNKRTKKFGLPQKSYLKFDEASDSKDFSTSTLKEYYDLNSFPYDADNPATLSSNFIKKDNRIYTLITFGYRSFPTLAYSLDEGNTWIFIKTPQISLQYESSLAFLNGMWYIICRKNGVFCSKDNFETYTQIERIYQGTTRPDIITCGNDVILCISNDLVAESNLAPNARTNITFFKGNGTNIKKYKKVLHLINEYGIAYFRLINYKGIFYLVTTLGELYPEHHDGGVNCKDGIYFVRLGKL